MLIGSAQVMQDLLAGQGIIAVAVNKGKRMFVESWKQVEGDQPNAAEEDRRSSCKVPAKQEIGRAHV